MSGQKRAVFYVSDVDEALEYVRGELKESHNVFSVGGIKKSIVTKDTIYKSAAGFGGAKLAYECLYLWKQRGYSGSPSSPVAFFREVCEQSTNIKAGTNFSLSSHFHGGWIANTSTGFHHGKTYLYDIVSAYRWAGSLGLPTETRFFTDKPKTENWIAVVKMKMRKPEHPDFLQKDVTVLTSEDIGIYDIKFEYLYGFDLMNFDYNPETDLEKLKYLPEKCFKLATQSYWGIWAMNGFVRVERLTDEGELKEWKLYNRNKKMIWAILIIHRVTAKVFTAFEGNGKVLNVYVDSILTRKPLENVSEIKGGWKLKNTFDDGVFIKNAGVWTSIDNFIKNGKQYDRWIKHSGYSA